MVVRCSLYSIVDFMERTNFENLKVYHLSEDLADNIWEIVAEWNNFARDTVGKQLVRSADSIGANIAEGTGRGGFQDNKRFFYIARGSVKIGRASCRERV